MGAGEGSAPVPSVCVADGCNRDATRLCSACDYDRDDPTDGPAVLCDRQECYDAVHCTKKLRRLHEAHVVQVGASPSLRRLHGECRTHAGQRLEPGKVGEEIKLLCAKCVLADSERTAVDWAVDKAAVRTMLAKEKDTAQAALDRAEAAANGPVDGHSDAKALQALCGAAEEARRAVDELEEALKAAVATRKEDRRKIREVHRQRFEHARDMCASADVLLELPEGTAFQLEHIDVLQKAVADLRQVDADLSKVVAEFTQKLGQAAEAAVEQFVAVQDKLKTHQAALTDLAGRTWKHIAELGQITHVAVSPDKRVFFAGNRDVWEIDSETGRLRCNFPVRNIAQQHQVPEPIFPVLGLALLPDEAKLVVAMRHDGYVDNVVVNFNTSEGCYTEGYYLGKGRYHQLLDGTDFPVAIATNRLAFKGSGTNIEVYNAAALGANYLVMPFQFEGFQEVTQVIHTVGHGSAVTALSLSDDEAALLSGGADGNVKLWAISDADQPLVQQRMFDFGAAVDSVGFARAGKAVVACGADMGLQVWCRETGVVLRRLDEYCRASGGLAFVLRKAKDAPADDIRVVRLD